MKIMNRAVLATAALMLASCSSPTTTTTGTAPKEPEKPAEFLTGRQAFQQMYPMARSWALDAQPVLVQSINLSKLVSHDGKAPAWEATFYSPSMQKTKMYSWSAIESEGNLHKGVFAGSEESARAPHVFEVAAIRTDSDEAYKTAVDKSADFLKTNANMPVFFVLEMTNRFPDLTWRVVWGESISASPYSVYVDASTGKFLQHIR